MRIAFLGATGTVTGSRYLLEKSRGRMLVDCGLFQGLKTLRLRNWSPIPTDVSKLNAVLLTHAHLDHSGYLPRLVREGFQGTIFGTEPTLEIARILLLDSAKLMEEDADHARRHGYSKHKKPVPLYTQRDAELCFRRFSPLRWGDSQRLPGGFEIEIRRAGHILGASSVSVRSGNIRVAFSGDLGRTGDPLLPDPEPPPASDYVVIESTYGNRVHPAVDPMGQLEQHILAVKARGGKVIIPAFAVGRTQYILYCLSELRKQKRIPDLPVFVDSPMASKVTALYARHASEHCWDTQACERIFAGAHYVEDREESMRLTQREGSCVILSASGMATGGRVLNHLQGCAGDPRNLILFSGYQAAGTRGSDLVSGRKEIKIHGEYVEVRCEVAQLESASAHADAPGLLTWLGKIPSPPRRVFVTHGEPSAADALRRQIVDKLGFDAVTPEYGEKVELG